MVNFDPAPGDHADGEDGSQYGHLQNDIPDEEPVEVPASESDDDEFGPLITLADEHYGGEEEEPLFTPPLYIQRYCAVEKVIEAFVDSGNNIKSLVDLGCAELKFLVRAKNGNNFQRIVGVDMDEFLLGSHSRKVNPQVFEMINKRQTPLKMEVYTGDATLPDARLVDIDVVTAIELIEHMDEPTHAPLVTTVFDVMQPLLAVFTTPNVEYNPLFPGGSIQQRRHWDHRFEWTRAQFQAWGDNVVKRYPYTVEYTGVGETGGTLESHGHCSQIAIFTRNPDVTRAKRTIATFPHKLMREIDYPWSPPKTLDEEILDIMDGECYSQAKEMQEVEENAGRYNQEWFTFTVSELYEARWRLQSMLQPPSHLDHIRKALMKVNNGGLKYDEVNDTVAYQLLGPDSYNDEENYDDGPNIDMENYDDLGHNVEMEEAVAELADPGERNDYSWG